MPKNVKHNLLDDITRGRYAQVVNLKISTKQRSFFLLTPLLIIVIIVGVLVWYRHSTEAQVVEFYPSSCLGSWLGTMNASGKSDVPLGSLFGDFNNNNSAVYDGGSKQIFCGGFTGELPQLATVKQVKLKLHWVNTKKREIISITPEGGMVEQIIDLPTDEVLPDNSATSSPATDESIIIPKDLSAPQIVPEETPADIPVDETLSPPSPDTVEEPQGTTEPVSEQTIEPQARLLRLVNFARAAETIVSTTPAEPVVLDESGNVVNLESAYLEGSKTSTSTNELDSENISVPVVADPAVLQTFSVNEKNIPIDNTALFVIKYSLDGTNWQFLAYVYPDAWPTEFDLPVYSSAELNKLQISIESLPLAEDNLIVWLDNMSLEVLFQSDEEIVTKKTVTPAEQRSLKTYDERSQHYCSVEPFVVTVPVGATTTATLKLTSFSNKATRLVAGDLPVGVKIDFTDSNTTAVSMTVVTSPEASAGSYNIIVVYQEEQYDNEWLPNFCQFNLIIKQST
jgi:hypothetical protein